MFVYSAAGAATVLLHLENTIPGALQKRGAGDSLYLVCSK